jgi:hypothetical protein
MRSRHQFETLRLSNENEAKTAAWREVGTRERDGVSERPPNAERTPNNDLLNRISRGRTAEFEASADSERRPLEGRSTD